MDAMFLQETWEKILLLCVFCAYASTFQEQICNFCLSCMHNTSKSASVSSGTNTSTTLRKNWKGCICFLLLFNEWQNLELLRGYPYFRNTLLIIVISRNKYGTATMVDMYVFCYLTSSGSVSAQSEIVLKTSALSYLTSSGRLTAAQCNCPMKKRSLCGTVRLSYEKKCSLLGTKCSIVSLSYEKPVLYYLTQWDFLQPTTVADHIKVGY